MLCGGGEPGHVVPFIAGGVLDSCVGLGVCIISIGITKFVGRFNGSLVIGSKSVSTDMDIDGTGNGNGKLCFRFVSSANLFAKSFRIDSAAVLLSLSMA